MPTDPALLRNVLEALEFQPDHIWMEDDLALLGWGTRDRLHVGSGPDRYHRAYSELALVGGVAFASFTFDPDVDGSYVVVPETVARVDAGDIDFLYGERPSRRDRPSALPGHQLTTSTDDWYASFQAAMSALARPDVEKIVLSRTIQVTFESDVPMPLLARNLIKTQPDSYIFSVDGLVGSSPELLARLRGRHVISVSLAGSVDREGNDNGSLSTRKNIREHDFAADSVDAALRPMVGALDRSDPHQATFADIVHLATRFEGDVEDDTTVLDVIARHHPTAAVAGTPTNTAMALIRKLEPHERDRYAGPIGWFDESGDGTFAIALRCGKVGHRTATLFSGAGLVEGSDYETEYAETEMKLRPMLRALGVS